MPLCGECHPKAHGRAGHWDTTALVRRALHEKAARGERISGQIPYGYQLQGKQLVRCHKEQRVLCLMRILRKRGLGATIIARELNARGIRPRLASTWNRCTIEKILGLYSQKRTIDSFTPASD